MSNVISDSKKALENARLFSPKIYQECGMGVAPWDFIIPLASSEPLIQAMQKPTLNFSIREDEEFWYAFYMVYHKYDYSTLPIGFLKKLDEHPNDTESILFRICKGTGRIDVATVSHYMFIFASNVDKKIVIEAGSHAIRPYSSGAPRRNHIVYSIFDYFNLNTVSPEDWEVMRKAVAPACMPDEQYDCRMVGSSSGRLHNKKGDIYLRPEKVFKSAELKGWI